MSIKWNIPEPGTLLSRLAPHEGKVDMVLDTDTYNEVDDQFALCYSLCSPERLDVEAVYAAPFHNDRSTGPADGMQKSYGEIKRLLGDMGVCADSFVFKGSTAYLPDHETPVDSPAARDLVKKALARPKDNPLYVVAIGAVTNVASALLLEPAIAQSVVIVWLGGTPLGYPHTQEFNLIQDVPAARVIFDSGAPVVLVPSLGVSSHMLSSVPEMNAYLRGANPMCDTLADLFSAYSSDHFAWTKEIWDVAAIGYMINSDWVPTVLEPSPLLTDDFHWARDARRHMIRVAYFAHRNPIFRDMYTKLRAFNA